MRKFLKMCGIVFALSCAGGIARMAIDPTYSQQVAYEQQARKDKEVQAQADKALECEETRNLTQQQWTNMSQLLQITIATECRPQFAPERTAKELLNSAGRAAQRSTARVGNAIEETLNKPF